MSNPFVRALARLAVACAVVASGVSARAQVTAAFCGPVYVAGAYGPYDYRSDRDKLPVVENAHFTPPVEALIRGRTGQTVGPDLNYTLEKFPNHHRALMAVRRLAQDKLRVMQSRLPRPPECYFERALRFRPDDVVARMIYARFLIGEARRADAERELGAVVDQAGSNPLTHQNAGLIYLELKDYDKALRQAWVTHRIEPSQTLLQEALQAAGKWREPSVEEAAAAAAAASAPATSDAAAPDPAASAAAAS